MSLRGANVRIPFSFEQAYAQIKLFLPEALVLSLAFEEFAGLDMIISIKKLYPDIGIVTLANLGKTNDMKQSLKLGARRCLMKPFQIGELLEALEDTIRNP